MPPDQPRGAQEILIRPDADLGGVRIAHLISGYLPPAVLQRTLDA
jgi:hypothetical protein